MHLIQLSSSVKCTQGCSIYGVNLINNKFNLFLETEKYERDTST